MNEEDKKNLQQIAGSVGGMVAVLEGIGDDVKKLAAAIPGPSSYGKRAIDIIITIITISGLLAVVDILIKWFGG